MNKFEKLVYDLVRDNPRLKKRIRNLYQDIFDFLPSQKKQSSYEIISRDGFFFGFHDHTPFSYDNTKLLANRPKFDLKIPSTSDELDIGYFDGEDFKDFHKVGSTSTWTWHLGCKLQWKGNSNNIIFNDHIDGNNISRQINLDSGNEKIYPGSIGSVSPDGSYGVGYSFARVQDCMPGYGYIHAVDEDDLEDLTPYNSGIYKIDFNSGNKKHLISIGELAEIKPTKSMKNAKHFFTHTQVSPDSSRFMFLHRWINPYGNIDRRFSRLVVCDLNGNIQDIFRTSEMVSHITWQDSNHVVAYCRLPEFDNQYGLFKVGDEESTQVLGIGQFGGDGHPSFDSTKRWMVTDTYPNRRRVQDLILYDINKKKKFTIAKLPMPKKYQSPSSKLHWTCDLHPRWDRNSQFLCFDSTFNGKRSLCTIDLGFDIKNNSVKGL